MTVATDEAEEVGTRHAKAKRSALTLGVESAHLAAIVDSPAVCAGEARSRALGRK